MDRRSEGGRGVGRRGGRSGIRRVVGTDQAGPRKQETPKSGRRKGTGGKTSKGDGRGENKLSADGRGRVSGEPRVRQDQESKSGGGR